MLNELKVKLEDRLIDLERLNGLPENKKKSMGLGTTPKC